ncbi:hypothetical protein MPH_13531 [Macrophomina phaseolina MS6]|uniref:Fungal-type protein kinase domain-containing protein n=1 Tax=Macrophomina phaseolina (strain MS6) TaxID=1126212 RepID=K2R985_MACPH|nr:hypothetical protein MPH_13531 [Macrophomina phaseolina MS6]
MTQLSESQLAIIRARPIEDALDSFRNAFRSAHPRASLRGGLDHFQQLVAQPARKNLMLQLINAFQIHPAASILPSRDGAGLIISDLALVYARLSTDKTNVKHTARLVKNVVDRESDATIWTTVYDLIRQTQPVPPTITSITPFPTAHLRTPPKSITSATRSIQQTPNTRATSSIANSSEFRKYFDEELKAELKGSLFVGVPNFFETFFGQVEGLQQTAETVFQKCREGDDPLYETGSWRGWPERSTQNDVLRWFTRIVDRLKTLAEEHCSVDSIQRTTLAQPDKYVEGSVADRKMDAGFVAVTEDGRHWSQILVAGELKGNPDLDRSSQTWRDLARYAREVFTAQDTRRFVLGFTLCGSTMRLWEFDRLGGTASEPFDVNEDGPRFVSAVLGYLLMNNEQLGFDPTILEVDGKRVVEVTRNDQTERLVLDKLIKRAPCVVGRATTCWKAYREGDESRSPLVVKDSWQYPERDEEGELLREAAVPEKEVVNVARYYHHETVRVNGQEDDVYDSIRKGLDVVKAKNYRPSDSMPPPNTSGSVRTTRSSSRAGQKRSSSSIDAPEPSSKRTRSSAQFTATGPVPENRVHRRVIVRDYGKPIYKAGSRVALLAAMDGCIRGHQTLYKEANILQRDVSANNLMINEDSGNPSWKAFLIDLDLAINKEREGASGAKGKTGTLAFMAIGILFGEEQHSFMHDLESFFWVLFWICIHYDGPGNERVVPRFEKWNYADPVELAGTKLGVVANEGMFRKTITDHFTEYYQPLVPWINELRKKVFPNGGVWEYEEPKLYLEMADVLREAREDSRVK